MVASQAFQRARGPVRAALHAQPKLPKVLDEARRVASVAAHEHEGSDPVLGSCEKAPMAAP
jgi:hypothetical protein